MKAAPPAPQPQEPEALVEVDDEDTDYAADGASLIVPPTPAAAGRATSAAAGGEGADAGTDGADDDGLQYRVVWDSGARAGVEQLSVSEEGQDAAAARLKEDGNAALRAGRHADALRLYERALLRCGAAAAGARRPGDARAAGDALAAALHSNASAALLALGRPAEAAAAAAAAHAARPRWPKPLLRLARAHLAAGDHAAAAAACRAGARLAAPAARGGAARRAPAFDALLDAVAVAGAAAGCDAAYDGATLRVRAAGADAWLGRPAPYVPELDGPPEEGDDEAEAIAAAAAAARRRALPPGGGAGPAAAAAPGSLALAASASSLSFSSPAAATGGALAAWDFRGSALAGGLPGARRTSFRSVREAVAAARDGDRLLLERGTHNGLGECVELAKRLLVEGEGAPGEAVLDARANVPAFRVTAPGVVIRNLEIDFTGFREAVLVTAPARAAGDAPERRVAPLLDGVAVKCSGDDAVVVAGGAAPTLRRCVLAAKKCGLRAVDAAAPRLERCVIEKCGRQGVRAMDAARVALERCVIKGCEAEAVVAMDAARVELAGCALRDCKGPGADVSDDAQLVMTGGAVEGCVGGVWLWDGARAELRGASLAGGPAHALLVDGRGLADARRCVVRGSVHADDATWAGLLGGGRDNAFEGPDQPTDFPPEEGPFRFEPDPYTRKM